MPLDPNVVGQVTGGLEEAYESGRLDGRTEAQAEYFGNSARVLTGNLFAQALEGAAQMLGQYDAEAASYFNEKAGEIHAWVTPPQVQVVEPTDSATGIALGSAVSAKFVLPGIKPETITPESFYVYPAAGGSHLAGEVAYDEPTSTASFVPTNQLSPQTEYTAVLDASIAAVGGMLLGAPYTWSFQTGDA